MRILMITLFLVILPLTCRAEVQCKKPDARYADIGCATELFDNADKGLNEAYKALSASLSQEGKSALKEAQRAWILFRDADTAFAFQSSGEGGSLGGLIATNHKIDLTNERTRELKKFLNVAGKP